jgi:DNA-binding MarR family transcriptional regulator
MTSRLGRLEEAGFVKRRPAPDDRRGVVIELTDAGREIGTAPRACRAAARPSSASALSKEEQRQLNDLLRKLMLAFEERESSTTTT